MSVIATLLPFMILPVIFLTGCIFFLFIAKRKHGRAGFYGLLAYFLSFVLGAYSIFQSSSSTAGIGFLFLPVFALFPGVIGFALGKVQTVYLRRKQNNNSTRLQKILLAVLALLLIAPYASQTDTLLSILAKKEARAIKVAEDRKAFRRNSDKIKQLISENPGNEGQILEELARDTNDRTLLIPIAQSKFASPELLDKMGRSQDLGVALTVVRNKNTSVKTLIWIHKNQSYPPYFYSTLARNPNTPREILHELYEKRAVNGGISRGLARNVNVPEDILVKLIGTQDKFVMRNLLERPNLTCAQLEKIKETINKMENGNLKRLTDKSNQKVNTCLPTHSQ